MVADTPILCHAALRAGPGKLAAIWLFLIILPVCILTAITDLILSESEQQIAQEAQLKLTQEVQDFRDCLSFSFMVEQKMTDFAKQHKTRLPIFSASDFIEVFKAEAGFMPAAVFSLSGTQPALSFHIAPEVKKDLGLISHTMLKNFLTDFSRPEGENLKESARVQRFREYLRKVLSSTGDLRIKRSRAMPVLSGKPSLNRLLLFFQPAGEGENNKTGHFLIFRERDIEPALLVAFATGMSSNKGFRRRITTSNEGLNAIYRLSQNHMKFLTDPHEGISLLSLPSTELLLRLVSRGTLYPFKFNETVAKLPLLKVTAPPETLMHPLRPTLHRLKVPVLIMVMLATIIILRLHFFGFGSNLKLGPRLFVSVFAASILPFSTFIAAAAWHQKFIEDFARAEIRQFIQLQADQASRNISASLNSLELKVVSLRKELGRRDFKDAVAFLADWLRQNAASMALYHQTDREEMITVRDGLEFDDFENEMKQMGLMALLKSLEPENFSETSNESLLGMVKIKARAFSIVLDNVGKLHKFSAYKLNSVYATFPVFADDSGFSAPKAIALIKFDTFDLLKQLTRLKPELLQTEQHGNYTVQKCFIPLSLPNELPPAKDILCNAGFPFDKVRPIVEKISQSLSASAWTDGETSNVAMYLHHLGCILVIRAMPVQQIDTSMFQTGLLALLFFVMLVGTLVNFLRKSLVEPIHLLQAGAARVAAGDFSQPVVYHSGDEFETLTNSFNRMSADLLQKERLASYVSEEVIQEISSGNGTNLQPGGERLEVAVLFVAMADFKAFRQQHEPEAVTEAIGNLIDQAAEIAARYNGNIDKMVEDTLMLVFRQRGSDGSHVESVCRTALALSKAFGKEGRFRLLAGIAAGPAVSGKIGSRSGKLDYTVIGNPVNLAARLKTQAGKALETGIIVCPNTIRMLRGLARLRFIERTEIKGRSRTFPLYELLEMREK